MPELRLTGRARRDLLELPGGVRDAVLESLAVIRGDSQGAGERLLGRLKGLWLARVGSYRILYTIEHGGVIVRALRHRAVAYRPRRPQ